MREVNIVLNSNHPNIVHILELIKEDNYLALALELLDENVCHYIKVEQSC